MKRLLLLLACAFSLLGLTSCDLGDLENMGGYGNNYGGGYNGGYRGNYDRNYGGNYGNGYNNGYSGGYRRDNDHDSHRSSDKPEHCYCSHKSCGCRPGHSKSGCNCDGGEHRH